MKANGDHIVPRPQEPRSENIGTARLVKKLVDDVKATASITAGSTGNHIVPRSQEPKSDKFGTTEDKTLDYKKQNFKKMVDDVTATLCPGSRSPVTKSLTPPRTTCLP